MVYEYVLLDLEELKISFESKVHKVPIILHWLVASALPLTWSEAARKQDPDRDGSSTVPYEILPK